MGIRRGGGVNRVDGTLLILVVLLLLVAGLGAWAVVPGGAATRCGEQSGVTLRIHRPLRMLWHRASIYRFQRPSIHVVDVTRIGDALGVRGRVRVTATGYQITTSLNPLSLYRLPIGWLLASDIEPAVAEQLVADQAKPGSAAAADVVARRVVERLGISTQGWHINVGSIPEPGQPRTVDLTPSLDGRALPFGIPPWSIEIDEHGRAQHLDNGLLFSLVRDATAPALDPNVVARSLGQRTSPYATTELGFNPITPQHRAPSVIPALPPLAPDKIPCSGAYYSQLLGAVLFSGRVLTDPPTAPWTRHMNLDITGVHPTVAVVVRDHHATRALLVPAYQFDAIEQVGHERPHHVSLGPQLAIRLHTQIAELLD